MNLPSDYRARVRAGVAVLRALGARLRLLAAARPDAPELWLSVRDYEGLADRLAASSDRDWENGSADILITGQDLGVLDELIARADTSPVTISDAEAASLADLREFLRRYRERAFQLDEPVA